ncbi:MAG: hypothetical protein Q4G17_08750, partial [Staphylococcus xylosus]|nr:hypothetical protein [Staphylococcus xylosus]
NDYYHTSYSLESLDFELKEMIKRVKDKMRDENKGISKFRGYLKQSVLNEFKKYDISLYQSELELSGEKWMAISQEKLNNQYSNFGKQIDATEEELDALGVG